MEINMSTYTHCKMNHSFLLLCILHMLRMNLGINLNTAIKMKKLVS